MPEFCKKLADILSAYKVIIGKNINYFVIFKVLCYILFAFCIGFINLDLNRIITRTNQITKL